MVPPELARLRAPTPRFFNGVALRPGLVASRLSSGGIGVDCPSNALATVYGSRPFSAAAYLPAICGPEGWRTRTPGKVEVLRPIRLLFAILAIHTLVLSSTAAGRSDVIIDAVGDVPATAPAYVDIVQAKVTEQVGRDVLFFHMTLAGPAPSVPGGFVGWNWAIDSFGGPAPDYAVVVRWCDRATFSQCAPGPAHWESALIAGTVITLNAFPFEVSGATVKAYLNPALIGNPAAFNWWAVSRLFPGPTGIPPTDLAPDSALVTGGSTFTR